MAHRYGYYRQRKDETGWKSSIRHNLTVHDCFVKVMRDKSKGENGKGGFWQVDEELAQHEVDFSQRGLVGYPDFPKNKGSTDTSTPPTRAFHLSLGDGLSPASRHRRRVA